MIRIGYATKINLGEDLQDEAARGGHDADMIVRCKPTVFALEHFPGQFSEIMQVPIG